ncbi:hypothetical protein ACIQPQ_31275 [Streptomyces sp. NPDC091281]|uniref:hypothetical protein n=1 Tax=Streptomyces sp. NPDC091281 TaxID=3365985 RepID=UPI0037F831EA
MSDLSTARARVHAMLSDPDGLVTRELDARLDELLAAATAELESFRALELGDPDGRVSAACGDPSHPTWLRAKGDGRGCPWCRIAELEKLTPASIQTCTECGAGYTLGEACSVCEYRKWIAAEKGTTQ